MSSSLPWCAASGTAPTPRGSRGHGLGARCRMSRQDSRKGDRGLAVDQGGRAVRQHGVDSLQAPVALQWMWSDPHLVVLAIVSSNTIMAMVLGSSSRGWRAARAVSGYCSAMFVRLSPLLPAVRFSYSARPSYSGM